MRAVPEDDDSHELPMTIDTSMIAILNKSEIDQQIATAHKYPRSIKRFRDETLQMVTLSETIAAECSYALIRKEKGGSNKVIEGPSARFAEVISSAWGNCRSGARTVDDTGDFVTAQGVFHDLERNSAITFEVKRRITGANGRRYSADMIAVTANAACSIALRNAVLKGVPKAFWQDMWAAARKCAVGDMKSLGNKRADAMKQFTAYGVSEQQVLAKLGRAGIQDVSIEDLSLLLGLLTALKEGDSTPEELFAPTETGTVVAMPRAKPASEAAAVGAEVVAPEAKAQPTETKPAADAPAGDAKPPISESMRKMLVAKLASAGKTDKELAAAFGVESIDALTVDRINDALAWVTQ